MVLVAEPIPKLFPIAQTIIIRRQCILERSVEENITQLAVFFVIMTPPARKYDLHQIHIVCFENLLRSGF